MKYFIKNYLCNETNNIINKHNQKELCDETFTYIDLLMLGD